MMPIHRGPARANYRGSSLIGRSSIPRGLIKYSESKIATCHTRTKKIPEHDTRCHHLAREVLQVKTSVYIFLPAVDFTR